MELAGRHVVVTGGSRGMGAALGTAFAAAGARVTLVARSADQLSAVAARIGGGHIAADLLDLEQLPDLATRLAAIAPVDIVVHNAGLGTPGQIDDLTGEQLRDLFTLNVVVPAELSRLLLPEMRSRGTGRLVFISSLSAQVALPGLTSYSATKAAVSQLAEGLRRDLRPTGVGVITAELGPVATELYDDATAYPPTKDAFNRMLRLGMLTMLAPDDVASAVVRACRKDRSRVVLPRRAGAQVIASHLPQWLANRML